MTIILWEGSDNLNLISHRLGNCVVCGERIYSDKEYVRSSDGFCCKECLREDKSEAVAAA
ncbi:hypothetical protein ACK3SF_01915 [Candidatus Nanosalina sp. VS9-1]|uniref:hypothetical protein n=1 Tax=Candidatus Nanosalina sp. VS9-1 TaxID=3388566 RepID=UPI0039E1C365